MRSVQQINFSGKLDKDTEPALVNPNDYTDALNCQFLTDDTESGRNQIPMKGNVSAFDPGSVSVQNKVWRLYTEQDGSQSFKLNFIDQNGVIFKTDSTIDLSKPISGAAPTQTSQILAFVQANVDGAATVVGTGTTSGYIDITLTSIPGYDIVLSLSAFPTFEVADFARLEIRQEAYDASCTGELNNLESCDVIGDLYAWYTPQTHLPETKQLTVTSVLNNGNRYQLQFSTAHNLISGQKISITNSGTAVDGIWIITVIDATNIKLEEYHNTFTVIATPFDVTITTYLEGVGELGVGVKDINADTWSYTRLLRTKEWNFRTKKQIDGRPYQRTANKDSLYFTDDYNNPRCFYYSKPYVQDGALKINGGRYEYGSIALETKNIVSATGMAVRFTNQIQSGGQVTSGNWRYSVRGLTETLSPSNWTQLTNPVNVCVADVTFLGTQANLIIGDEPGFVTPKINELEITGIVPGFFKYIELAGINYVGDAIEGFIIKRILLDGISDTLALQHTGNEADTSILDVSLLNVVSASINTAKSNEIIDNRLIYSNLTFNQENDITAWAQTFKHSLLQKPILRAGGNSPGEYQDWYNVNNYVGYTQNEVYRFGVRARFKNGGFWSDAFWVDDIAFTTYATNLKADGTSPASQWSDPARRNAGLPDFNMTGTAVIPRVSLSAVGCVFVPYVQFENIDLNYVVDGIKIIDLIDRIEIVRCELIPEVNCCGVGVLSVVGTANMGQTGAGNYLISSEDPAVFPSPLPSVDRIEYPFISGNSGSGLTTNPTYPYTVGGESDFVADRKYCAFYAPDVTFNGKNISVRDKVLNHGNPTVFGFVNGVQSASPAYSNYSNFSGVTDVDNTLIEQLTSTDAVLLGKGSDAMIAGKLFRKANPVSMGFAPGTTGYANSALGFVVHTTGNFANPSGKADYGLRYLQFYSPIKDKYGFTTLGKYVTCGNIIDIDENSSSPLSIEVFGGDTFTQKTYFKHRYASSIDNGQAGGIEFYSQNKINVQMKMKSAGTTQNLFPGVSAVGWLESQNTINEAYQNGYSIKNGVQISIAFDPTAERISDCPDWIQWSELKLGAGGLDAFRNFPPLNFHVLNGSYGEIMHHANGNGELITWQQRAFMRQYFNTRGTLEVKAITEILIGDGSVMSRDGVTISRLGSKHKWGIIKGKSDGGSDVFYWINTELKKAIRFGYDGVVSVGDIKGMQSFLANNLTWVNDKDTPADGEGIRGVWDDRYANVLWTVIGKNPIYTTWDASVSYLSNASINKVYYSSDPFNTIGDVYENIAAPFVSNIGHQPDISPTWWRLVPKQWQYFNRYTLIFNEFKNAFTTFTSPTPKIYLKWLDTYLSPRPISPVSKAYQHNQGSYLTWYEHNGVSLQERGYIEGVINALPQRLDSEIKWYEALGFDSLICPPRVEFNNSFQQSFLNANEFEARETNFYAPIKEDSTVTGQNDQNTSLLYDMYLKVKTYFEINVYQELKSITVKFRVSPRVKSK